ncbi:MAG: class I SAM-dependent methyltransferase [Deltaproteobacteria bacterium]|nr:class I SAM-dependent methyltransferase [Deltaproteobacteria bacterium]
MKRVRLRDLLISFLPDGRVLVRSGSTGVGLKGPPVLVAILAACSRPLSKHELEKAMGPQAGLIYDHLAEAGLLVDPEVAGETPLIFGNYSGVEVHRRMLSDEVRLSKYREALAAVVKPGDVVIDAGSGTGVLAVMAALAGAARVYAIEKTEFAENIAQVAADSGVGDRVIVVQDDFGKVVLPEKAQVIVTETYGAWAFGEGMMPDLAACAQNNLAPGGVIIPHATSLYVAPLRQAPDHLTAPFRAREDGVNLSSLLHEAVERSTIFPVDPAQVGEPRLVARVEMPCDGTFEGEVELDGPAEALVGWYDLHMAPGIDLKTGPFDPMTHWKQSVMAIPLEEGAQRFHVEAGPADEDSRVLLAVFEGEREHRVRFR